MKLILYITSIFLFINIEAAGLQKHIDTFGYDFLNDTITDIEKRELDRISFENSSPYFPDKIIRLYLIASQINKEPDFTRELKAFESVIKEIEPQTKGLSSYNRAEKILHILHDIYFKTELTGSGAGYNIGIEDTLRSKRFNCYKSALIYNAVLEYFGYESYLVIVPEHIFSVVLIDGRQIEVETTNRFGFDPYDRGAPGHKREFDKPGVIFDKKNYSSKTPVDNISIISIIYSNRLLLYTGQKRYTGYSVKPDFERAAALGVLGLYMHGKSTNLANNIIYPFYRISSGNMKKDPASISKYVKQFSEFLAHSRFAPYRPMYNKNISIAVLESQPALRESYLSSANPISADTVTDAYIQSLKSVESNSQSAEITETAWNNITIDYNHDLAKQINTDSIEGIKNYALQQKRLFETLSEYKHSSKYKSMAAYNTTVILNNYILKIYGTKNYQKALSEIDRGIDLLEKQLSFYDKKVMDSVKKNREIIVEAIGRQ